MNMGVKAMRQYLEGLMYVSATGYPVKSTPGVRLARRFCNYIARHHIPHPKSLEAVVQRLTSYRNTLGTFFVSPTARY